MDDVDEAEQDDDLDGERNQRQQRMVALLLVQLVLLLADGLTVAVVLDLDAIDGGHDLDHLDAVLLHPQRHRHEDDLGDDGEQEDGQPPVAREGVTGLDYELQHARNR